jgi:CheY-like chemotaxis protein
MPQRFDLVITGYLMPHMTGEILVQELRHIRSNIPIILCTDSGLNHDAKKPRPSVWMPWP